MLKAIIDWFLRREKSLEDVLSPLTKLQGNLEKFAEKQLQTHIKHEHAINKAYDRVEKLKTTSALCIDKRADALAVSKNLENLLTAPPAAPK